MLTIRPAVPDDLAHIMAIVERAVDEMNHRGNPQWGPGYPSLAHYAGALAEGSLYVAEDGALLGCAVFNTEEEPAYASVSWSLPGPALVIHKMVVDPDAQRRGVASALFAQCEALARAQGLSSLRVDTYTKNDRMQSLLRKQGFSLAGEVHFPMNPLPYLCFEKILTAIPCNSE